MFNVIINGLNYSLTATELKTARAKGVKVCFTL